MTITDDDASGEGDALTVELVETVAHGTLTLGADGSFSYTPAAGYVGVDQFRYRLFDRVDRSEPVIVSLEVHNAAPQSHQVVRGQVLHVDAASGVLGAARDSEASRSYKRRRRARSTRRSPSVFASIPTLDAVLQCLLPIFTHPSFQTHTEVLLGSLGVFVYP